MKRYIFILCLALTATSVAWAQRYEIGPRHELRLGIGVAPQATVAYDGFRANSWDYLYEGTSGSAYDDMKIIDGALFKAPSVSLAYTCRLKPWCELGVNVAYACSYRENSSVADGRTLQRDHEHLFMFAPTVRFVWFRRDYVRLYSSVGIGMTYIHHNRKVLGEAWPRTENRVVGLGDLVLFGVSAGGKVFGYCEVGSMSYGVFACGVGVRFNDKRQK